MVRNILLIFIIVILMASVTTFGYLDIMASNSCGYSGKAIPSNTPSCSLNNYPFQDQIWLDMGLKVYGNYSSVAGNDFKNATQDQNGKVTENKGYYSRNSQQGEYRYHGFDYQGQPYSNINFPNDADSNRSLEEKSWIYQPWNEGYSYLQQHHMLFAPHRQFFYETYIRENVIEKIPNGIQLPNSTPPSKDPINYMYVYQVPDLISPGAGIMWHKHPITGKVWYQTFHMPKVEGGRNMTPVRTEIKVLEPEPISLQRHKGKSTIPVKVRVNGYLEDEPYLSTEADKFAFYTREDIEEWTLEITMPSGVEPKTKVKSVGNKGSAEFVIEVPVDRIDQTTQTYLSNARATVHFSDGRTNAAMGSKAIRFGGEALAFKSLFSIRELIEFGKRSEFKSYFLNYVDMSIGEDIVQFELTIKNDKSKAQKIFTYETDQVVNETVQNDLFSFMISDFTQETSAVEQRGDYIVSQTITLADGKQDTHTEHVIVIQKPHFTPPIYIDPNLQVPQYGFDVVGVKIEDLTDMTHVEERVCYIDDVIVNQNELFSGSYVFGIGQDGFHNVRCDYTSTTGDESTHSRWIYILDTKPKVQFQLSGSYKENRKMSLRNDSQMANFPMVWDAYPVTQYEWVVQTMEGSDLRFSTDTDDLKEFLSNTPGVYSITMIGTNDLGRESDPYTVEFPILKDIEPAVVLHPFDAQIARGERVRLMYDAQSVDDDIISKQWVEIYYDSKNDGSYDQLLEAFDPADGFDEYVPPTDQLGKYKIVATAEEIFGQETIPALLDGTEQRVGRAETFFEVDNFQPASSVYTDIPFIFLEIDVYFMLDKDLQRSKNNYILQNRITINNMLRSKNIEPMVEAWDMHTYVYSSEAWTSRNTGQSYPSSSIPYTSGAYSGTLYLERVSNNPYTVDEGRYETRTETRSFSDSCTNTRYKLPDGSWSGSDSECPSSMSVNSDGYSGSIPRTGYSLVGETETSRTFVAYYSGTLSKSVRYWVPNPVSYDDYTGFYSGFIYRYVRQAYDNSFFRVHSDKYVVYISDSNVNDLSDLQIAMRNNDAKLILVGQEAMKRQIEHEHHILNNKPIEEIVEEVIQYIADHNPSIPQFYTLIREPFQLFFNHHDVEGDPIVQEQTMYIQDELFFDNSTGLSSFAVREYDPAAWQPAFKVNRFDHPGKYSIIRRVQDQPSSNPTFESYSYFSNEATLDVIAHRKPIASLKLDWDFVPQRSVYKTSWVDLSYDLDHQFSRADKGIVERKMKLTRNNSETFTKIPDELYPGSYRLEYVVKDPEHAWSDPFIMNFTLQPAPPIQLRANAKAKLEPRFSLSSIPSSEELLLFDVWTRYPYEVQLEVALYQGSTRRTPLQTVRYSNATGSKQGNDIFWKDITHAIPNTLADGAYTLKITAIGTTTGMREELSFPVQVRTPIQLTPIDHPLELVVDEPYTLQASTTKYPHQTTITLFQNTRYQSVLNLRDTLINQGWDKHWQANLIIPDIPDGHYTVEYLSRTPNGQLERVTRPVKVIHNRPPVAGFTIAPNPIFEGDTVQITSTAYDPDPNDYITHHYLLTMPDGSTLEFTDEHPAFRILQVGAYTLTQTVTDRFGKTDSMTKTFDVRELTITGFVDHTEKWKEIHGKLGHAPEQFYSGERFMLRAEVTDHVIDEVTVEFSGLQVNGQVLNLLTPLREDRVSYWSHSLYAESMTNARTRLQEGAVTFLFTVHYANGIVKTDTVEVEIIGSVYDASQYHRTK